MCAFKEEDVHILTNLGLTTRQAKAYLALVCSGMSTAAAISKISKVKREDLYRVLATLEELGLVEKTITAPALFRANSVQSVISMLIDRKNTEASEIAAKAEKMLTNFKTKQQTGNYQEEVTDFMIVSSQTAIFKRRKALENVKKSVDVVNSWTRHNKTLFIFSEEIEKALQRGVKFRIAVPKPLSKQQKASKFKNNYDFKTRYLNNHMSKTTPAMLSIYDGKEALIATSPLGRSEDPSLLWTANESIIVLAQAYFQIVWNNSLRQNSLANKKRSAPEKPAEIDSSH